MNHPWSSAHQDFEQNVLPALVRRGHEIGERYAEADPVATKVIDYYVLLRKSFDPMTLVFLKDAFAEYERAYPE